MPPPRRRLSRADRALRAARVAEPHDGVAHRAELRAQGVSRDDIRTEVAAGRWRLAGRHTVVVGTGPLTQAARFRQAVWESGSGAVLDGAAALVVAGMTGYTLDVVDVSVPSANRCHEVAGVRLHRPRAVGPTAGSSLPRATTELATIRAAGWARTDRAAALLVCLPVQQRLLRCDRLLAAWHEVRRSPRSEFLGTVIRDVCDGAQALGELDLARLCRRVGLPAPDRQVVRRHAGGRVYLDAVWEDVGLVLEVDGGHHALALNPVDDALRQNEVTIGGETVLRVPVLALRLYPQRVADQIGRARAELLRRAA